MKLQNFEIKSQKIKEEFLKLKNEAPARFKKRLNLSWSNWIFGLESIEDTAIRLQRNKIEFIELNGNRQGNDIGYKASETKKILSGHGIKTAGICGIFSPDNDFSSNRGVITQNAIDYVKRNTELGRELGADYFLLVPSAVGRSQKIDDREFERAVIALRRVADIFTDTNIKGAIEPIRSSEVSLCHTVQDALDIIKAIDHPGIQHINGDIYHMHTEEAHIGEAILKCSNRIVNLHFADSNRRALGEESIDIDTVIMALYILGYNRNGCYVTPEPLGPGGDSYVALFGLQEKEVLDELVRQTVSYFREREEVLVSSI
jgi:sugar phosphate isomerase/epimerase